MPLKKYLEIEWRQIRLDRDISNEECKWFLNIAANYPTTSVQSNICEKLISGLHMQRTQTGFALAPATELDGLLFAGYVENLIQVAITVVAMDSQALESMGISKTKDISATNAFPLLGIAEMVFAGTIEFLEDSSHIIGYWILQLQRNVKWPIDSSMVGKLSRGDRSIGEIELRIYIEPVETEFSSLYQEVAIFPHSPQKIAVYYSGDLSNTKQLYMVWTTDNWESNPLIKMKRLGESWAAIISPPISESTQLELAFTDAEGHWDNRDGSNWVFDHFLWI